MRRFLLIAVVVFGCCGVYAQAPVGTLAADDTARQDAMSARIRDAETALEQGDYKGAAAKLKGLAAEWPKDAHVLYDLGFAEERVGDDAGATQAYTDAIAADAAMGEPRVALGLMDARGGRMEKARQELMGAANLTSAAPEWRGRASMRFPVTPARYPKQPASARKRTPHDVRMRNPRKGSTGKARASLPRPASPAPRNSERVLPPRQFSGRQTGR